MFFYILCFFVNFLKAEISDTLKQPDCPTIKKINGKQCNVILGNTKSKILLKIYFSPFCDHCSVFLPQLLSDKTISQKLQKNEIGILLMPVAFYQKIDKHAIELCSSTNNFWGSLKIFLDTKFNKNDFFKENWLFFEQTPTYSKEIADQIIKNLKDYLKVIKKERRAAAEHIKNIEKEELVEIMIKKAKTENTFSDIKYGNFLYKRRDDITNEKRELNVPTVFIFANNKWTLYEGSVETNALIKHLRSKSFI